MTSNPSCDSLPGFRAQKKHADCFSGQVSILWGGSIYNALAQNLLSTRLFMHRGQ
jgi:hypothetical protein